MEARRLKPLPAPFTVDLISRDSVNSFGRTENIQVVLGREPPDAQAATTFGRVLLDMSRRHPDGMGLIVVVQKSSTPMPEARAIILESFQASWKSIRSVLFVLEAGGFPAAVQRAVVSGVILTVRLRSRIRTVSTVEESLPWFLEELNGEAPTESKISGLALAVKSFCNFESVAKRPPVAFNPRKSI